VLHQITKTEHQTQYHEQTLNGKVVPNRAGTIHKFQPRKKVHYSQLYQMQLTGLEEPVILGYLDQLISTSISLTTLK